MRRIKSKRPRILCYKNTGEVKEEKLKCNMKGKTKKTCQTMKSNKQNKEHYMEGREIKINKIIINIITKNKM